METHTFFGALADITFQQPTLGVYVALGLAIVLVAVSGFASGSEISFFSLSPSDVSELNESKDLKDAQIRLLREDSERTLATILVTNNFVNVTIIMLFNYVFHSIFYFGPNAYLLEFLIITVFLTFILLLFGEIMPKIYCRQSPLRTCRRFVGGLMFARKLFWPVENLLLKSQGLANRMMQTNGRVLSVDDLEQALELTDKTEIKDEEGILQGIIRFGDEAAKEVMTSRQDIVALELQSDFADVIKCVVENNYSRIPVFQRDVDHIRGVLYIKDLLPHLSKPASFRWQSLIRPPYFVPELKKIDDLLKEFQSNKIHIAIVVDEFGGTSGLITMEDILEEIVGEINDEFDEEEKQYSKINYNTYIFEGKILLTDFAKIVDVDDEILRDAEGEADTLAGLLLELKGDFPSKFEKIEYKQFIFEIVEIEDRRIKRVKVTIL